MTGRRIVAGIDPGSQCVGWAVATRRDDGRLERLASGVWMLGRAPVPVAERLQKLHAAVDALLAEWQPALLGLESAFFGRNARSALRLGEARGAILVASGAHEVEVLELPPATVKRRVAGAGAADKGRIAELVRMHFELPGHAFATEDESDALAVAACVLLGLDAERATASRSRQSGLPPGASVQ